MLNEYNKIKSNLYNNKQIRELIINNPDLPLMFFTTEDANSGEYYNEVNLNVSASVQYITQYNDEIIFDDEEYLKELIADSLYDYKNPLSDDELEKLVEEEAKKYVWIDVIAIELR